MVAPASTFQSLERQDEFVYHALAMYLPGPGVFLDVACGAPISANNTYFFEKYLNWTGLAFDIGNVEEDAAWSTHRSAPFTQVDATSAEFTTKLGELLDVYSGDRKVDYISLDVDGGGNNYGDQALARIMDANVEFKIMTLEHEEFKYGPALANRTRELLRGKGYTPLFQNVCQPDGSPWEDWWINPATFPVDNIMSISAGNLLFDDAVERVKAFIPR